MRTPRGGWTDISASLTGCALTLLRKALDERRSGVYARRSTHYSSYALGSIVLLVDAFETWLNEAAGSYFMFKQQPKQELANLSSIARKYYRLAELVANTTIPQNSELETAIDLRSEIVHHLPRPAGPAHPLPPWLEELRRRGLFVGGQEDDGYVLVADDLASYALAYWAWETVAMAIADFLKAVGSQGDIVAGTASNFDRYREIRPPSQLPDFDLKYNIKLTDPNKPVEEHP